MRPEVERDANDAVAAAHRDRPQHRRIEKREREDADAESAAEHDDGQQRERGTLAKETERVADVLPVEHVELRGRDRAILGAFNRLRTRVVVVSFALQCGAALTDDAASSERDEA